MGRMPKMPSDEVLLQLYLRFLRDEQSRAHSTCVQYVRAARAWVTWLRARGRSPAQATRDDAAAWVAALRQRGYGAITIAGYITGARRFCELLDREGVIRHDPFRYIRRPHIHRRAMTFIDGASLIALLERVPAATPRDIRDRAMLAIFQASAMRNAQLRLLDVEDVHLDACPPTVKVPAIKRGDESEAWLPPVVVEAVRAWLHVRPMWADRGEKALFVGVKGRRIDASTVCRAMRRLGALAQMPARITPHVVRRSVITAMYDAGASAEDCQMVAGHKHLNTTLDFYIRRRPSRRIWIAQRYHPLSQVMAARQ